MRRIYGTAAGSLRTNTAWAVSDTVARIGATGELKTAEVLESFAASPVGIVVLHDLQVRWRKYRFNIDHLVTSGRTVHILDTKTWAPGFYWTFQGHTRRGLKSIPHADKKSLPLTAAFLEQYLGNYGIEFQIAKPILVVWPSSTASNLSLGLYRPSGARAITGARLTAFLDRLPGGLHDAAPALVHALLPLIDEQQHGMSA